jgi:hypothetical protein
VLAARVPAARSSARCSVRNVGASLVRSQSCEKDDQQLVSERRIVGLLVRPGDAGVTSRCAPCVQDQRRRRFKARHASLPGGAEVSDHGVLAANSSASKRATLLLSWASRHPRRCLDSRIGRDAAASSAWPDPNRCIGTACAGADRGARQADFRNRPIAAVRLARGRLLSSRSLFAADDRVGDIRIATAQAPRVSNAALAPERPNGLLHRQLGEGVHRDGALHRQSARPRRAGASERHVAAVVR